MKKRRRRRSDRSSPKEREGETSAKNQQEHDFRATFPLCSFPAPLSLPFPQQRKERGRTRSAEMSRRRRHSSETAAAKGEGERGSESTRNTLRFSSPQTTVSSLSSLSLYRSRWVSSAARPLKLTVPALNAFSRNLQTSSSTSSSGLATTTTKRMSS